MIRFESPSYRLSEMAEERLSSQGGSDQTEDLLGERLRSEAERASDERVRALSRLFADRAYKAGLLDVAVAHVDSPLGQLLVATTPDGLVRVAYRLQGFDAVLTDLSERVSPRVLEAPARLDEVRRQLDDYFCGRRTRFDLPLDWRLTKGFRRRVLEVTARIPYGATASYREVASAAGSANAVRAAGTALAKNPLPIVVPCHRVLRSGGGLGGYGGGLDSKTHLLELEGAAPR